MGAFFRPVIGAGIFLVLIGWLARWHAAQIEYGHRRLG
jgi:hypothetical protein